MWNGSCTSGPAYREGEYLTDQQRLYRVLQVLPAKPSDAAAILEDCATLEAAVYPAVQLASMCLRRVRQRGC